MEEATIKLASHGTGLLMHNNRLADPLDSFAKELSRLSKVRKKTDDTLAEMARVEWEGGLYMGEDEDGQAGPIIPAENFTKCLIEAARKSRAGKEVERGVFVDGDATLKYDGPRDVDGLYAEEFFLRKPVKVKTATVIRTRPYFPDWSATFEVLVNTDIVADRDTFEGWAELAGQQIGLCDYRPRYGRFEVEVSWA